MRIYNKHQKCEKCGDGGITNPAASHFAIHNEPGYDPIEVIVRKCRECGYQWNELPLDTEVEL